MSGDLVRVRDLDVGFARRGVQAVRGVSFILGRGRITAIVGESGSGKSVLARSLVGLAGDGATVRAAELAFDGIDLTARPPWRSLRGRRIGFVLQDALGSLDPLRRVGAEIAEPLREHRIVPSRQIPDETVRLLEQVGVPGPRTRARQYPHELSGGLRQRALIASALAARPDLLIADEPTTALDATVQRQVLRLLRERASEGLAILLITHDLGVVAEIADHVHVMRGGVFVEDGTARQILESPRHDYTRTLVGAGAPLARPHRPAHARTVLRADGLVKRFALPGGRAMLAVDDVSLTLRAGETLGIVGESGSGKTTVGRMLTGLTRPDAGTVEIDGLRWDSLDRRGLRDLRRRVQMIYQHPLGSFDPRYSVRALLEEPLRATGQSVTQDTAGDLLEQVGLPGDVLARRARELSGGQAQRLAIARALAAGPDVIVCDEPVSALDASIQAQVLELLADLQDRRGVGYVFVSHDLGVIRRLSDRVAVMREGRVVEEGEMERVFQAPAHPYTQELLEAVPRERSKR